MTRRTQIGLKLAVSSTVFLCLTVVTAVAIRALLSTRLQDRSPASGVTGIIFEHRGNLSVSELGMLGNHPLNRGRKVVFHEPQFRNAAVSGSRQVALNLFQDMTLTAEFQPPSALEVNENLYAGTILGDPDSTVRILIQNGSVDGTIKYHGFEYRLMDGSKGLVIITEDQTPSL